MSNSTIQLSDSQAYLAMFAFLENHYKRTGASDIGELLGSMALLPDGSPADPAVSKEWNQAIAAAFSSCGNAELQLSPHEPKSAA